MAHPLGEESLSVNRDRDDETTGDHVMEFELFRQRTAELQAAAAHERLVTEARRANRANRTDRGLRLGRLAGLRRTTRATAAAEC